MGRGRKPTPIPTLKLRGAYQPHRNAGPEPPSLSPDKPFDPPGWLAAEGKREWNRVIGPLIRYVGLAKIDRACLASYCQSWAEYVDAVAAVAREGSTIETKHGVVVNPMVRVRSAAKADVLKFAMQLGLTPSSRSGLFRTSSPSAASCSPVPSAESKFFA